MNADISPSGRVVEIDYETNRAIVRFEGAAPEIGIGVVFTANPPANSCVVFENAIRKFGVVAACEWFGYGSDSTFTEETFRILEYRAANSNKADA